jgi:DNA-binding ferritin-like protein
MDKLIALLKMMSDNIRVLHHNLVSGNWQADHEKFAEYYGKLDDIADAVIEMSIMTGGKDITVSDAVKMGVCPSIEVKPYYAKEAYALCLKYFMELVSEMDAVKEHLPKDCVSELESFQYDLRLEAQYKLAHRLAE